MPLNKNKAGYVTSTAAGGISSTNVQDALEELDTEKAPLASPTFTGTPAAPTPASSDNSTKLATTAYVRTRETGLQASIDLKAPLASPALTGNPTAPTQAAGNDSTRLANTAFVQAALDALFGSASIQNNGSIEINGLIIKWGYQASGGTTTSVTFATPFPSTVYTVLTTVRFDGDSNGTDSSAGVRAAPTVNGFEASTRNPWDGIFWIAIGE